MNENMSDTGTGTLLNQLDPRTLEDDLDTYERETHRPVGGVRDVVGRHVPEPACVWGSDYGSPPPREVGNDDDQDDVREYRIPQTMNAQSMIDAHYSTATLRGAPPPPSPQQGASNDRQSFVGLFHSISANQGASIRYASDPRPNPQSQPVDATYHEREEILAKVDDLRMMGFNMPGAQDLRSMTVEDLRSVVRRRTMSNDTHTVVETACTAISAFAQYLELGNSLLNGLLPLQGYSASVKAATATPRFKLAVYQIILKMGGRISTKPWMEIAIVIMFPILQSVISKLVVVMSRGRFPNANAQTIQNNMTSATSELTTVLRREPNDGGGIIDVPNEAEEDDDDDDDDDGGEGGPIHEHPRARARIPVSPMSTASNRRRPVQIPHGYIVAA